MDPQNKLASNITLVQSYNLSYFCMGLPNKVIDLLTDLYQDFVSPLYFIILTSHPFRWDIRGRQSETLKASKKSILRYVFSRFLRFFRAFGPQIASPMAVMHLIRCITANAHLNPSKRPFFGPKRPKKALWPHQKRLGPNLHKSAS